MSVDLGISSDYAVLTTTNARYYYGYEATDDAGEWCFQATMNGVGYRYDQKALGLDDKWNVVEGLLRGLGLMIERGNLR